MVSPFERNQAGAGTLKPVTGPAMMFRETNCSVEYETQMDTKHNSKKSNGLPPLEKELLAAAESSLAKMLPVGWGVSLERMSTSRDGVKPDTVFVIRAPDGRVGRLVGEVKSLINPKAVISLVQQMESWSEPGEGVLLVARYLSASTRKELRLREASYLDSTGNTYISLADPAVFIETKGGESDPFRRPGRGVSSLKAAPASRVARALLDFRPPWTMRDLEARSGTSLASVSRTVAFLDEEALVERDPRGSVINVAWEKLLRRWAEDRQLIRSGDLVRRMLAPRGLDWTADQLREIEIEYALSGSLAAQTWAPYASPRMGIIYTTGARQLIRELDAVEADGTANLLIIEPDDELALDRTCDEDGLTLAAPSQVCADLLAGPGRNPEEGLALLDWMKNNESEWRRDDV